MPSIRSLLIPAALVAALTGPVAASSANTSHEG
jgi:hypothetical protein